jgi:hypothetical protein
VPSGASGACLPARRAAFGPGVTVKEDDASISSGTSKLYP